MSKREHAVEAVPKPRSPEAAQVVLRHAKWIERYLFLAPKNENENYHSTTALGLESLLAGFCGQAERMESPTVTKEGLS